MPNQWFRMYSDFLNDHKMISLAFEDQRHFIGVLALKSEGVLDQDCDERLLDRIVAQRLWVDYSVIGEVKARIVDAGLIQTDWQPIAYIGPRNNRPPAKEWAIIRMRIFKRDDFTCQYCGKTNTRLECDHVDPVCNGGSHDDENLVAACFSCNRSKGGKSLEEWERTVN